MFTDYYLVLRVKADASEKEIKAAFIQQAVKWHPDKNPNEDTTKRMQEINEAYLILKDPEARIRYNKEYQRFKEFKDDQPNESFKHNQNDNNSSYTYYEYKPHDDLLNKWMFNAKKQAINLASKSIDDLKGMVFVGAKAAVKEVKIYFIVYLFISTLFIIVFYLMNACSNL